MKSESGVRFTRKLELAKDTHEFELREGAPYPLNPVQVRTIGSPLPKSGLRLSGLAASSAQSVPLEGGSLPASPLAPHPGSLDQSPSVHPTPSSSSALGCARFMPVSTSSPLFLWLGPPPTPVALSSRGVGELLPHPVQHRSQRWSWACLGLHCFFQTFILPLSAEQSSCPRSWDRMPLPL